MTTPPTQKSSIFDDEDWSILMPSTVVTLGTKNIHITPMTLTNFSSISSKTVAVVTKLVKLGLFSGGINLTRDIKTVTSIIVSEAPELISMLTGIPECDIVRLPILKLSELLVSAFEINSRDQETMEKNLDGLARLLQMLTGGVMQIVERERQADQKIEDSEPTSNS